MEPGGSMPHSQGLSNNSYPEPNQPNYPHWYLSLQDTFSEFDTGAGKWKHCNSSSSEEGCAVNRVYACCKGAWRQERTSVTIKRILQPRPGCINIGDRSSAPKHSTLTQESQYVLRGARETHSSSLASADHSRAFWISKQQIQTVAYHK